VYEKRFWGSGDDASDLYYSGSGSYDPCVPEYVPLVKSIIQLRNVRTVTEIGCGDFAVARQYADDCTNYLGLDVVKGLIERNKRMFGNDRIKFRLCDATKQQLEPSDLCIIRQVFQHLSNADILKILSNHQSKALLLTEHLPARHDLRGVNRDKKSGGDIRAQFGSGVFIDRPPFNQNAEVLLDRPFETDGSRLVTWLISNA
jgi:hypothetical protein